MKQFLKKILIFSVIVTAIFAAYEMALLMVPVPPIIKIFILVIVFGYCYSLIHHDTSGERQLL